MNTTLRKLSPLLGIAAAQLFFLAQGSMLGCGFSNSLGGDVDDDKDHQNFYTCGCRCETTLRQTIKVATAFDDAEQTLRGDDNDAATDLDLGVVFVGLRFTDIAIPPGAVVLSAFVHFTADQGFAGDNTTPLNLEVYGEASADAAPFGGNFVNGIATRPRTLASAAWMVPPWALGEAGMAQRTPDLSAVLQEVVDGPGWQVGNAMALFFAGTGGRREAEAFDGMPALAPVIEISYLVGTDQTLNVCMPDALNPNFGQPVPTDEQLQNDCTGRVEHTLSNLALACQFPSTCTCNSVADSRRFNAGCNDPCVEVPLNADCSNFDPATSVPDATNSVGDPPVCVASRLAPGGNGPAGVTAAAFGAASECHVVGQATIEVGDETKVTPARGAVSILGEPCPGEACAVGIAFELMLDPITFEVRWHSDPRFENLTASAASPIDAAIIGPTGFGALEAETVQSSLRGERPILLELLTLTRAYELANPDPVGVFVDWDDHVCALFGNAAATVDDEGEHDLLAEVSVQGTIVNEPPHAAAGADQLIECTSPDGATVVLDGTASSDPEDNAVVFAWSEDDGAGPRLGEGLRLALQQAVGVTRTAVLRVVDAYGQTDEDDSVITVQDTTAPTLSLEASPAILWSPNHKLAPVTVAVTTADACDAEVAIRLVSIASNEGDLADGAGHTSPDIQDAEFGTDDRAFLLRAERSGTGSGRIYTITYEAEDASGNVGTATVTVSVSKSQPAP